MISLSLLIARRYIHETKKIKNISTILKMSLISISIGSFALALALSIMLGFEKIMHEKMQNIHSQIIIQSNKNHLNYENIAKILEKEFPEIESYAPSDIQFAVINESNDISNVIAIKGILPENENRINNLFSKITKKISTNYENLLKNNQVLIGEKLAKELNFSIGEEIILWVPQKSISSKLNFEKHKVIISGLFNTGIDDFDSKIIFSSLEFIIKNFTESGITQIGIKLKNNNDELSVIKKLKKRFKLNSYCWKDLYPALMSTLKLEKYIIFFIFSLISLIAGMNIISLLFMITIHKKKDLIILKSMGLSNNELQKIFLFIGILITIVANVSGLFFSFLASLILKKVSFIKLPDTYCLSHLPIHIDIKIFILIFFIVVTIGTIASLISSKRISYCNIADELKNIN